MCSYVSQHSQENIRANKVTVLINMVEGLQLHSIFIKKEAPVLVFSWQLCQVVNNNNFFNT